MVKENAHKNFTACGDKEAEMLLEKVLSEMKEALSDTALCICLGGSYGRGDGGVRQDKANGILYNDLDFFAFARDPQENSYALLEEIAEKYEKELKVDVDFSRIMSIGDIKSNAKRLMMQELKRGYRLVSGEDLLEKYLPEHPADKLPFSEACRLWLNRGMGLLLAWEKIMENSADTDFILRNINKAILGACDAALIAEGKYKWTLNDRMTEINNSELSDACKEFYANAVEFKKSPNREVPLDLKNLWLSVRDIFRECMEYGCSDRCAAIWQQCKKHGEISLKNYIKYCIKSRTVPLWNWKCYTMPAVAILANEVFEKLDKLPPIAVSKSKLYQQWLIFN
jgi:hypothetical protein